MKSIIKKPEFKRRIVLVIALVVLCLVFAGVNNAFLRYSNVMTILLATSVNCVLAIGVSWPIMTGGIDISVGTVMTLSACISGLLFNNAKLPLVFCMIIGLLSAAACGYFNGTVMTRFGVPPMIATLAMQMIAKGLALLITDCKPVYFTDSSWYQNIAISNFLGIPGLYNAVVILLVIVVITHIIFAKTVIGRYTLAIGSNDEAVRLSGISTDRWRRITYTLCSTYAGIAGILMSSRLNSAQPALGTGYEMDAIAAAVIGGNALSGGEGTIWGTLVGALIISTLQNGLRILQISTETQYALIGVVLIFTVAFDSKRKMRKN